MTKEEAIEVLGLCSQIDDEIHNSIRKKIIQYCWDRTWFDAAFKYREVIKD